jgi:cobalt-zinc-cadmium efflux system protein
MGAGHSHAHALPTTQNEKALSWALGLITTFLVVEIISGLLMNSLALLAEAAHLFTDAAALAIALAAVRIARRPADAKRTYGYHRFEILAAAFNTLLLFALAIYIMIEAWTRFHHPEVVHSDGMIIVAILGLIVNLISIRLLSSGKDTSLNMKGAYLEVWSDMLGSIGVVAGGVLIAFTGWVWVDTVVAASIGLWVLPRSWVLLKESLNILLEGVPDGIDLAALEQAIIQAKGVVSVHDLHIWALTSGKNSLTAHVVHDQTTIAAELIVELEQMLAKRFAVVHTTFQCELTPCPQAQDGCAFLDNHCH